MPFDTPQPEFSDAQLHSELAETQAKLEAGTLGAPPEGTPGAPGTPGVAEDIAGEGGDGALPFRIKQRMKALTSAQQSSWTDVWHVPALLLGLGLFGVGIARVWPKPQEDHFHEALDQAERLLEARQLDRAATELNNVGAHLERAPLDVQGRFHEIDADRLFLSLKDAEPGVPLTDVGRGNRASILDAYAKATRKYTEFAEQNPDAEETHRTLDDQSLHFKARVLVSRGERDKALQMLEELAGAQPRRRYSLVRSLIEQEQAKPGGGNAQEVLRLLGRFQAELADEKDQDRDRFIDQMVWLYRTEAKMRVEAKETNRAIDELMVAIQRLRSWDAPPEKEAPLLTEIGEIYLDMGDYDRAETHLKSAQSRLAPGHPLHAPILVSMGDIYLSKPGGGVEDAQGLYRDVVVNYKGEPAYIDGLVGLADTQARSPDDPKQWSLSVDHFGQAIELMHERLGPPQNVWGDQHQNAADRIQTHAEFLMTSEHHERALRYLKLLQRLYGDTLTPAELMLWMADSHHALAEELRALAEALDPKRPDPGEVASDVMAMQAQRRREAAVHYEDAAVNYVGYAHKMSGADDEAHGNGLWKGATSFDYAQLPQRAIDTYAEFVFTRQSDPRVAEAKNRLGRAYMALGDYQAAIDQFEDIQTQFPKSTWAVDGLIPQARSYARMEKLDQAERILKSVLADHPTVGPESEEYEEALIALGTLYYARGKQRPGDYEEAINYLSQAEDRYGDTEQGPRLRFLLADSYRQSVDPLREQLQIRQSQSDRLAFQAQIQQRLTTAAGLFNTVRNELEQVPKELIQGDDLKSMYLRNAYFYEADAVYDLGRYEEAIALYANAATRWQAHPAALVAMVQTVNAYCELGEFERARVQNRHAEELLGRLPDDVFEDGSMPMSREHWANWLRWTGQLEFLGTASQGADGAGS